jgi:glycosyltransferase involved in cell wall biosynthesis
VTVTLDPVVDTALTQRLRSVAEVLLVDDTSPQSSWEDLADLLHLLVADVHRNPTPARMWLLCTAISTVMPDAVDVREALRTFELSTVDEAMHWLMELCLGTALAFGNPLLELQIVRDAVIVEVDFSARFNLHTGIQRVTRAVLPRWDRDHDVIPVAWAPGYGAFRTLAADESDRVLRWHGGPGDAANTSVSSLDTQAWAIVVPWNCVVVIAEVPSRLVCERLAGVAEHSGNHVVGIGYDCIPVVSADMVPLAEPNRFVRYLSIVKHMRRVAGISAAAAAEFAGFARALPAQGLLGPEVFECLLPTETIGADLADAAPTSRGDSLPTILCVGSFEPRKNHVAVLYAAETLWREGLEFRVQLIGGSGWGNELPALIKRLTKGGRSLAVSRAVSDDDLQQAFRTARFSVFASLHEGFGLPVAESLAYHLPVITSSNGSTAEIAASGGALLIDPRSDEELTDAMRLLLTDDGLLAELRAQTYGTIARSWDDYSGELWSKLIEPERRVGAL